MENLRVKELQISGLRGGERPHEVDPPSELGTPAATETMSTEWTDEKHSMYLKSMEASFVNQLYNSMDTRGRHKGNLSHIKSSKQPQFNSRAASGQFKVLRGGCWQKINFGRGEAEVNKSDQPCGDLLANPWILHFRSTCKPKDVESPILQEQAAAICEEVDSSLKKEITSAPATCSKQFNVSHSHLMHQDMVGGNTEVSDQNFADEDIKEKKAITSCNSKRMKTLILQASSNDQLHERRVCKRKRMDCLVTF
ncbi:cold-regulated protein 27 isoform X1 [Rosa chinensis]|uniref:cold-regulated protein 27 isoform X1 n=1 Tax=Rosa chinensis TaxID=74649 RepID=UPI000D096AD5|nr:cold-regulated protein 27 isoform X1 [Rosa chinensis]